MWYALKNLPSILWNIENWLNIIDLAEKLLNISNGKCINDDEKNNFIFPTIEQKNNFDIDENSNPIRIDLLFMALHRSQSSTNHMYQILNNFGSYILKFISTLYYFSIDPLSNIEKLRLNINKTLTKNSSHHTTDYFPENLI